MALLISRTDFLGKIDISPNLSDAKLNAQILLAQDLDLVNLMECNFYNSIISTPLDYPELINGGTYTVNGVTIPFAGLKTVLVYFTGARLTKKLDSHFTPNGIMQKRNEYSDHVELKEKIFDANQYENIAIAYWNKLIPYLDSDPVKYPLWKNNCRCENKSGFRPRIKSVGYGR